MTSSHGDRIDSLLAQFRRKLPQLMVFNRAQILRRVDAVKQRLAFRAHAFPAKKMQLLVAMQS
jgi:hypothetical protein